MAAQYPTPSISGPTINKLIDQPVEYVKTVFEFEDGGADVNVQPCGLRRWVLIYEGLAAADVTTLRTHFNDARGKVETFDFYHSRDDVTYETVRYESFQIQKHERYWAKSARVVLVKLI